MTHSYKLQIYGYRGNRTEWRVYKDRWNVPAHSIGGISEVFSGIRSVAYHAQDQGRVFFKARSNELGSRVGQLWRASNSISRKQRKGATLANEPLWAVTSTTPVSAVPLILKRNMANNIQYLTGVVSTLFDVEATLFVTYDILRTYWEISSPWSLRWWSYNPATSYAYWGFRNNKGFEKAYTVQRRRSCGSI